MVIIERILTTLQIIMAVIVMILVLLQSDNESGSIVSAPVERGNSMGLSKNARLAKMTAIVGTGFIILTIASATLMMVNNI
jgi:protein translocase SecG subunit